MSKDSDLSAYEVQRLENIRRNAEFLAQLGLVPISKHVEERKREVEAIKEKKKVVKAIRDTKELNPLGLRRSTRLNIVKEETGTSQLDNANVTSVPDEQEEYIGFPQESNQLDDSEFQVYAALRKWRLFRARELGIETYKIFQNRTLCEMIRRRRDDRTWARDGTVGEAAPEIEGESDIDNTADAIPPYSASIARDLTDCWGVGPSKVKEGSGFAWEALAVLNRPALEKLLDTARAAVEEAQQVKDDNL